jgi:hypothetical protein
MKWSQQFHKCGTLLQMYDFLLLQGFLNKKKQQFFLTRFFALWFCRSLNNIIIMIMAGTCSIMWSCSLGMPQSTLASPQAKASLIVYVFPFCFVSFWHCSKLFSLKLFIIFILLCVVDSILVHHCWHLWKEESDPKITFHNPTLAKCEDEIHTPKVGDLESSGTPECLKFDSKAKNTLHWSVLSVIGKVLKCRCPKWLHIDHLDICSLSYE